MHLYGYIDGRVVIAMTCMNILCIGDAHLGLSSSQIEYASEDLSIAQVWQASIDEAVSRKVDAVVLTGDMADSENSYFEAYGVLKRGIDRLTQHNIPVFAVAGNHDFDVFPRLVDDMQSDNITLLGPDGTWTTAVLTTESGERIAFTGWSFPSKHFTSSPLDSFQLPDENVPIIGVVHGDLDGGQSSYAPLKSSMLQQLPVSIWLLGHIHAAKYYQGPGTPILYPGSLQALDAGETGTHGPWLVTLEAGDAIQVRQLPLATVRYEKTDIDVSGLTGKDEIESRMAERLHQSTADLALEFAALRHVIYRPRLLGKTTQYRELRKRNWSELGQLVTNAGALRGSVDRVLVDVRPDHDLEEIAGFGDPPAVLAQWLLDLKHNPDSHPLMHDALVAFEKISKAKPYAPLGKGLPDSETITALVIQQGELLLEELMSQRDHE